MEAVVCTYQTKLKSLLDKFLDKKSEVHVDANFDKLLTCLRQQEQTEVESTLITLATFAEWIEKAVVEWSTTRVYLRPNIASFILELVSFLVKYGDRFCGLNTNNFFIKLVNVSKARCASDVGVKLAYIKLLSSFLDHTSGIEWMIACNFWEDIYQWCLSDQSEKVVKEGINFMSKILEKAVDVDESFCNGVVKKIMLPLGENIYRSIKASDNMADVSEEVASRYLKPTLKLIGSTLEYFLEGVYFGKKNFSVLLIFLKNFHLEERISDFMIIAQAKCLGFDIGKIMFIMQFLELYVKMVTNSINMANVDAIIKRMKNNYFVNISKGNFETVVEFCTFGQLLWHLIDSKVSPLQVKRCKDCYFANELFIFLIVPPYCLLLKYCWEKDQIEEILSDEFRDRFLHKIFRMMSQDGVRACYHWRDNIIVRPDLFKLATLVNDRIRESRKYFSKEAAILATETLIHFLEDLVNSVKEFPRKLEPFLDEMCYFSEIFEILVILFEEFHITWQDALQSTNVLTITFDFLMINRWPTYIVVQVLKLINVATAKYMAPNLALLLDSTTDSTIALMGPLLYAKLHDEVSEVKGAALEVVRTMARMSNTNKHKMVSLKPDNEI